MVNFCWLISGKGNRGKGADGDWLERGKKGGVARKQGREVCLVLGRGLVLGERGTELEELGGGAECLVSDVGVCAKKINAQYEYYCAFLVLR